MEIKNNDGVVTVTLEGRLDAVTAPKLPEIVEQETYTKLTVDMEKLEYISSAGLRGLLQCQKISAAKKADMTLKKPSAAVYDVMRMSGFTKILNIEE